MDLRYNLESLGLGAYQGILAAVALFILLVLAWRAMSALSRRQADNTPLAPGELVGLMWPPIAWLGFMLIAGVLFSSLQAYGPRVAIPKTELTISKDPTEVGGKIRDLTPKVLSDEERLKQQRKLEAETKERVNLNKN